MIVILLYSFWHMFGQKKEWERSSDEVVSSLVGGFERQGYFRPWSLRID
jgi:hypothetical protein